MAYAKVVSTLAQSTDSNTVTTAGINTTGADLIVIVATSTNGTAAPTDSNSNTWTNLTAEANGQAWVRLSYVFNPTVGAGHTFSISQVGSVPNIAVIAFSGGSAFDAEVGANATGVTSLNTGSLSPAENNEVFVAGLCPGILSSAVAIGSSFTLDQSADSNGFGHGVHMAFKIQTTGAAENPQWTWTTATSAATRIATFTGRGDPHYTLRRREHRPARFAPGLAR